ncbi:MAG: hypothetical protein ABH950_09425 [Candidatus Altiarchaeota archaeon]
MDKLTKLGLVWLVFGIILVGGYSIQYLKNINETIQKEELSTGGVYYSEDSYAWIKVGTYNSSVDTAEEMTEVTIKWLERDIYPQLEVAKNKLLTNTYEGANGSTLLYLQQEGHNKETVFFLNRSNLFIDPFVIHYPSEKPLTEEEIQPLNHFIENQSKNIGIYGHYKDSEGIDVFKVRLKGVGEGSWLGKSKPGQVIFPRGARVFHLGCERYYGGDDVMIFHTEKCLPINLIFRDGILYKRVTVGENFIGPGTPITRTSEEEFITRGKDWVKNKKQL